MGCVGLAGDGEERMGVIGSEIVASSFDAGKADNDFWVAAAR